MHPATQPMLQFVRLMQATHARAIVSAKPDRLHPGRTRYTITGSTRYCVQVAVDDLERMTRDNFGELATVEFLGPVSIETPQGWQWQAVGDVTLERP